MTEGSPRTKLVSHYLENVWSNWVRSSRRKGDDARSSNIFESLTSHNGSNRIAEKGNHLFIM